jgi:hypothetical protein
MDTEKKPTAAASLIDLDDTPDEDENPDHEKAFSAEQLQVGFTPSFSRLYLYSVNVIDVKFFLGVLHTYRLYILVLLLLWHALLSFSLTFLCRSKNKSRSKNRSKNKKRKRR